MGGRGSASGLGGALGGSSLAQGSFQIQTEPPQLANTVQQAQQAAEENGGVHIFGTLDEHFAADDARVYVRLLGASGDVIYEAFPIVESDLLKAKGVGADFGFSAHIDTSALAEGEYEIHVIGNKMESVSLGTLMIEKGE